MRVPKYVMINNRFEHKAGTVVYQAMQHDYGLARDDTNATNELHISVSLKEDGGYPFFTIPLDDLQPL